MYWLLFLLGSFTSVSSYCADPHKDYFNGSCLAPGGIDDFYSANLRCLNMNGYLATIFCNETNDLVYEMMQDRLTGPGTWIGIDQRNHWADGSEFTYTNWLPNKTFNDDCGLMDMKTGMWTTQPCTNRLGFLCMVDPDPDPENVCLGIVANNSDFIAPLCTPGHHCGKNWRVITIMALQDPDNYKIVNGRMDAMTKSCKKADEVYYISPSKLSAANSSNTPITPDPFKKNYFTDQYNKYPIDDTLDYDDAGDIVADMMDITDAYFDKPLGNMGGNVYIYIDMNCSVLCTPAFNTNQSSFLADMIQKGYSVNIFPMGDENQTDCINIAFAQCYKYHKDSCNIGNSTAADFHSGNDELICLPFHMPVGAIIGIALGSSFILILILVLGYLRYQFKRNGKYSRFWRAMAGVGLADLYGAEPDEWEVDKDQLEIFLEKELGSGAFAVVYEGKLTGRRPVDEIIPAAQFVSDRKEQVAVKRVPPHADKIAKQEFLSEINFMKKLGYHTHILGMIGCVVATDLPMMVLEFCENGDLLSYIRKNKDDFDLDGNGGLRPKDLLSISWQISDGLCYLKSLDLIHRDLAARNILLTKGLTAKISDFGLCRQPELSDSSSIYVSKGGRLPVKWMAPESLKNFHFSFKTDIWSFGVTLWEMYSFGEVPFLSVNPTAMLEVLESGERLPQGGIPDVVYKLLNKCWAMDPEDRRDIEELKHELNEILSSNSQYYGYVAVSNCSVIGVGDDIEFDDDDDIDDNDKF